MREEEKDVAKKKFYFIGNIQHKVLKLNFFIYEPRFFIESVEEREKENFLNSFKYGITR